MQALERFGMVPGDDIARHNRRYEIKDSCACVFVRVRTCVVSMPEMSGRVVWSCREAAPHVDEPAFTDSATGARIRSPPMISFSV